MDSIYRYVILGAGRQGVALAYDLARLGQAGSVCLADVSPAVAESAVARLRQLVPQSASVFSATPCNVADPPDVARCVRGAHVVLSAVPYRFNVALTDAAIATGASFCDLGGNTGVVRQQLAHNDRARESGVSVVPDCGLAPGLGNILAAHGVAQFDEPLHVYVRCGGLPQHPVGPLAYKLVFNFEGLINEYSGVGEFLRDGKRLDVPTLTEPESLEFELPPDAIADGLPPRLALEAAVTSGGTSTCAQTFFGRLQTYDYKTLRYPGHFAIIRALFGLGCFEEQLELDDGHAVTPRAVMRGLFEQRLQFPQVRDMVLLRTTVIGRRGGALRRLQWDLVDRHDEATGLTAMERTTAFPTAVVAHLQARRAIAPGARPLEQCIPTTEYMRELARRDLDIRLTESDA